MPLWQTYRALPPKTRIAIGGGIMAYATFALFLSDKAEEHFGYTPTEADRERLRGAVPRVQMVEREDRKG